MTRWQSGKRGAAAGCCLSCPQHGLPSPLSPHHPTSPAVRGVAPHSRQGRLAGTVARLDIDINFTRCPQPGVADKLRGCYRNSAEVHILNICSRQWLLLIQRAVVLIQRAVNRFCEVMRLHIFMEISSEVPIALIHGL